ncbi:MAG: hypothetical protein WC273_04620 [Dehalococcoidia bacterium]
MSRLPGPDPGWSESTEGDLDPDLAEEAGSSLDDWDEPAPPFLSTGAGRAVTIVLLLMILGAATAGVWLAR